MIPATLNINLDRCLQAASASSDPAVVMAIYMRLGVLFLDFKGQPAVCAMFYAVKMFARALKGALLGVFQGAWPDA